MKALINETIIIKNENADPENWKDFCNRFNKFNQEYAIFNKIKDNTILVAQQKILIPEENMTEFLSTLQEIQYCFGMDINISFKSWVYEIQTDQIVFTIQ